jgi:hypothetical protein
MPLPPGITEGLMEATSNSSLAFGLLASAADWQKPDEPSEAISVATPIARIIFGISFQVAPFFV